MKKEKKLFAYLRIMGSIGPKERWKLQEQLDKILKEKKIGEVSGGGTVLSLATKEICCCDIDIDLKEAKHIDELICAIKELNIKEKYSLNYNDKELNFN